MADPYEVLDLPRGAGEEEIRRRYLELVRQFPPEREPERFARIRAAYDQLRDPVARLKSQLIAFQTGDSLEAIQEEVKRRLRSARIPVEVLLALAERR